MSCPVPASVKSRPTKTQQKNRGRERKQQGSKLLFLSLTGNNYICQLCINRIKYLSNQSMKETRKPTATCCRNNCDKRQTKVKTAPGCEGIAPEGCFGYMCTMILEPSCGERVKQFWNACEKLVNLTTATMNVAHRSKFSVRYLVGNLFAHRKSGSIHGVSIQKSCTEDQLLA